MRGITLALMVAASPAVADINEEEAECLAKNIYFEARGEDVEGQIAVAWVTLNRVESDRFPDTVCDVVWQRSQFSWTHDGKTDTPRNVPAYDAAMEMAIDILFLHEWAEDPVQGSTFFHANWLEKEPFWAASFEFVAEIDNHIFYRNPNEAP